MDGTKMKRKEKAQSSLQEDKQGKGELKVFGTGLWPLVKTTCARANRRKTAIDGRNHLRVHCGGFGTRERKVADTQACGVERRDDSIGRLSSLDHSFHDPK
jgi:hypothetical protein